VISLSKKRGASTQGGSFNRGGSVTSEGSGEVWVALEGHPAQRQRGGNSFTRGIIAGSGGKREESSFLDSDEAREYFSREV